MDRSILNVTDDELASNVNVDSATLDAQQEEPFLMEEESCRESATEAARPSEMEFNDTSVNRIDKCDCVPGERVVPFEASDGGQARCPLCGKILVIEAQSSPQATGESLGLLFVQTFSNNLNFLPDTPETSLESNDSSIGELVGNNSRQQHTLSPAEQDFKTPVQDFCDTSVEIPCRDGDFTVFIIGQRIPETNELRLSAYVISSEITGKVENLQAHVNPISKV